QGGQRRCRQRRRADVINRGGLGRDALRGKGLELGEGPGALISLLGDPVHLVADGQTVNSGPQIHDLPRTVQSGDQREPVLHVLLGEAVDHRDIERVHPRSPNTEQNLALRTLRSLHFSNAPGFAEPTDGVCPHHAPPLQSATANPPPGDPFPDQNQEKNDGPSPPPTQSSSLRLIVKSCFLLSPYGPHRDGPYGLLQHPGPRPADASEPPEGNPAPDDLDHPERPRAGQESVDARERTADRESEDESSAPPLEGVHEHHEGERRDPVNRDRVHDEDDKYARRGGRILPSLSWPREAFEAGRTAFPNGS